MDVDEDSLSISTQYSSMASAIQKDNIEYVSEFSFLRKCNF